MTKPARTSSDLPARYKTGTGLLLEIRTPCVSRGDSRSATAASGATSNAARAPRAVLSASLPFAAFNRLLSALKRTRFALRFCGRSRGSRFLRTDRRTQSAQRNGWRQILCCQRYSDGRRRIVRSARRHVVEIGAGGRVIAEVRDAVELQCLIAQIVDDGDEVETTFG